MRKPIRAFAFFLILLAVLQASARATTVERLTLDELVKKARSIVIGKVSGERLVPAPKTHLVR